MKQTPGQISLFDLFEDDAPESMTAEDTVGIIGNITGLKFLSGANRFHYSAQYKKAVITLGFKKTDNGLRLTSTKVQHGTYFSGRPVDSIDESIRFIRREIEYIMQRR